ncbi:MAG: hypothetical protein ACRENC_16255, partial [Gemmatimonadaceae bacterium]
MKSHFRVIVLALFAASTSLATSVRAQKTDSTTQLKPGSPVPTPVVAVADTAPKKHGMFGKLKSVAQNKTVQSIAKTAVCTAVPGGSMVVSAVDAHNSGASAMDIAKGAGSTPGCMPGIPGMNGLKGMPGGMGPKGLGKAGVAGAVSMGAAQAASALQTATMNGAIARASTMGSPSAKGAPESVGTQAEMTQMQTAAAANGEAATEATGLQI